MSLWKKMSRVPREAWQLGQAWWSSSSSPMSFSRTHRRAWKDILWEQARGDPPNESAVALLRFHQQRTLLRYYGLWGYWQQQRRQRQLALLQASTRSLATTTSTPTTTTPAPPPPPQPIDPGAMAENPVSSDAALSSPDTTSTSLSPTPPPSVPADKEEITKGRVAFMVTAAMRQQLVQEYGYTPQEIKHLTPHQAHLILQQGLTPDQFYNNSHNTSSFSSPSPPLATDSPAPAHPPAEARGEESVTPVTTTMTNSIPSSSSSSSTTLSSSSPSSGRPAEPPEPPGSLATAGAHVFHSAGEPPPPHPGTRWYQVVQIIDPPGGGSSASTTTTTAATGSTETVVGLYRDRQEAAESVETRQWLNSRPRSKSLDPEDHHSSSAPSPPPPARPRYEIRAVVK